MIRAIITGITVFFVTHVLHSQVLIPRKDTLEFNLGEIVVTAEKVSQQYSSLIEISKNEINARSAMSAGEVLDQVPGAFVRTGYKNSTEIRVRGFEPEDIKILIDGRPLNPPYYGKVDLSMIPLDNIEKIKILKGPSSSLYGANAMGGVINIISSNPPPEGELKFKALYGSNRTSNLNVTYGKSINSFNFRVSASRSSSKGFSLSDDFKPTTLEDGGLRDNSDYRHINLDAKIGYVIPGRHVYSVSAGYYTSEKGLPSGIDEPRFWRFTEWGRSYLDFSWRMIIRKNLNVRTKLFYDKFKNRLIDYEDDSYSYSNIYFDSLHDNKDYGSLITLEYEHSKNALISMGLSLKNDIMDISDETYDYAEKHNILTSSISLQGEFSPFRYMYLSLGSSFNNLSYDEFSRNNSAFSSSFSMIYHYSDVSSISAGVSREIRFPTLHHLYSRSSGNLDLKEEYAIKWELSYERKFFKTVRTRIDIFRNNVKDMIERTKKGYRYFNLEKAHFQGFEVLIDTDFYPGSNIKFEYSYLNSKNYATGEPVPFNPAHKLNVKIQQSIPYNVDLSLFSRFVSEVLSYEGGRCDPFVVFDFKVDKYLKNGAMLFFSLKNIFDTNYEEEKGFPMPGRNFSAGLSRTF